MLLIAAGAVHVCGLERDVCFFVDRTMVAQVDDRRSGAVLLRRWSLV